MYVCLCVHMLIASHQTLAVSASTLYESELQYSVGEAGIGYPAGGSSTHLHAHRHTLLYYYSCECCQQYIPKPSEVRTSKISTLSVKNASSSS